MSTATFNATYRPQAEVDAQLTNGADVTVTDPRVAVGPAAVGTLAAVPGVRAVEPMQHRYAYVGTDLQDLYGVDPARSPAPPRLQDAYFSGGTAARSWHRLAAGPDAILVSAETVQDFQLLPGDPVNLRLQDGRPASRDGAVPLRGHRHEFPTAPRTASSWPTPTMSPPAPADAVGTFLVDTGGGTPAGAGPAALLGTSAA